MGPTLRCERVNIDVATIKTEEVITFEGQDYKRAEGREEESDSGNNASIHSFINDETGGLAVFLVSETTEGQTSFFKSMPATFSDSPPTLYREV